MIGFRKIVLETREPVVVNEDVERVPPETASRGAPGEPPKSAVFVPLLVGDRATGVISLQNIDREHAFSEADVRLLTTLAGSLSVALENARLFEETPAAQRELALINDISAAWPRAWTCRRCTTSSATGSGRSSTRRWSTSAILDREAA